MKRQKILWKESMSCSADADNRTATRFSLPNVDIRFSPSLASPVQGGLAIVHTLPSRCQRVFRDFLVFRGVFSRVCPELGLVFVNYRERRGASLGSLHHG